MSKINRRAATPGEKGAASKINKNNPTMSRAIRANPRKPLTPAQRGPFWQSVGEAIEQAARAAGRAS